jgi:hypothetical protein
MRLSIARVKASLPEHDLAARLLCVMGVRSHV